MIFTDRQITDTEINVRFYHYSDPYKGYGDSGTYMYITLPKDAFIEKENERFRPKDAKESDPIDTYFTYEFTDEYIEKLKSIISDYWWVDFGYKQANEEKRQEEIKIAKHMIKAAQYIKLKK